mgnify:CR=1 FL=1
MKFRFIDEHRRRRGGRSPDRWPVSAICRVLKVTRGGTEYCISAIPLGGYVKMAGESPDDPRKGEPDDLKKVAEYRKRPFALTRRKLGDDAWPRVMHPDEDVDDRLGVEAGNGGAADVMDAPWRPAPDRSFEERPLAIIKAHATLKTAGLC